jgi:hypothetical protein
MSGLIRIFSTLVVHVIAFLIMLLLVYAMFAGQDSMSDLLRNQYSDSPESIELIRSATMWRVIVADALVLAWSWIISSLWLLMAERQRPSDPVEGASMKPIWVIFLIIVLVGYASISWWMVWRSSAAIEIAPSVFSTTAIAAFFATFLAYFLGTAISVKTVMRRSVPLSGLVPNLGGRP